MSAELKGGGAGEGKQQNIRPPLHVYYVHVLRIYGQFIQHNNHFCHIPQYWEMNMLKIQIVLIDERAHGPPKLMESWTNMDKIIINYLH